METFIKNSSMIFKYAIGKSRMSGKEFHNCHEIVYFMDGQAVFTTENICKKLKPGSIVVIPKETYHRFTFSGDADRYTRCVFNFYPDRGNAVLSEKAMRTAVIEDNSGLVSIFEKLIPLSTGDYPEETKQAVAASALNVLLFGLSERDFVAPERKLSATTRGVLEIVENGLGEPLSVENIAKKLCVSPSGLYHDFKRDMQISPYRFILEKRLVAADKKIRGGVPAASAAAECGFSDYSGFYKQYKKMFGHAPSKKAGLSDRFI